MNHRELAENNFLAGYNCAQSVLLAFAEDLGLDGDFALRLSSSFGGGMGRLREVCGAVSAILMAAGLVYGYTAPGDDGAKAAHYARVQALAEAFRREHGSILCRELLARAGVADDGPQGSPRERTEAYYRSRPCVGFIRSAAALLEEQLAAEGRLLPFPCNDDNLYKEEP